jgi:hypothetical protein
MDGAVLSAPYDPETQRAPRETGPPRTEVMPDAKSFQPTQPARESVGSSTITESSPIDPPPIQSFAGSLKSGQPAAWIWLVLVVVFFTVLILLFKFA